MEWLAFTNRMQFAGHVFIGRRGSCSDETMHKQGLLSVGGILYRMRKNCINLQEFAIIIMAVELARATQ